MKNKLPIMALAALASFAVPAANAYTLMYSDSIGVIEGDTLTDVNRLHLTKFNTQGIYSLTKVEITITLSVPQVTITVDNDATQQATVTAFFGTLGPMFFGSSGTNITSDGDATITVADFSIATQSSQFTVGANADDSTTQFDDDIGDDNESFVTSTVLVGQITPREIAASKWVQYTGAGTVDFDIAVNFTTDVNLDTGGGFGLARFEGEVPTATYSATVTYTYVPEPGAALLGSLGLLALLRRRR